MYLFQRKHVQLFKRTSFVKTFYEQREVCEGELTEKEVTDALNKMENNKTLGSDGFRKEYFETFWFEIKSPLILYFKKVF